MVPRAALFLHDSDVVTWLYGELMCGRLVADDRIAPEVEKFVDAGDDYSHWTPAEIGHWDASYNIPPQADVPLMMIGRDDRLHFTPAFWTIVPPSSQEKKARYTFNAKAEKMLTNALWRSSFTKRRAIVFARGFYEWTGEKGHRTPHFLHNPDGALLGLAGLYSWWQEPEHRGVDSEGWHLTTSVLTSDSIPELVDVHDRSPVILPTEMWAQWIDPAVTGDEQLRDEAVAAGAAMAGQLVEYAVAPLRGNGPDLIKPATAG